MASREAIEHCERPARGEPCGALVFFHGVYGSREDFLPFMDKIDPAGHWHAFLPQGPYPMGEGRSAWGDPQTQGPVDLPTVLSWLDTLPFPRNACLLGGWSQGAAVAYGAALGVGQRPAAMVALGGRMPDDVPSELTHPLPRVFIAHGTNDDSVPVETARHARDRLTDAGAEVTYRETDVGHVIDQAVIPDLRVFVCAGVAARRTSRSPAIPTPRQT